MRLETSTGSIESYLAKSNFSNGFQALTSTGSATLNFTNCLMGHNLLGTTSTGSVTFKSYNMVYTTDITLNLETSTGSVNAELYQHIAMGANVSGTWETSTGSVNVIYRDTLVDTGFRFIGSIGAGSINYSGNGTISGLGSIYTSANYDSETFKYTFSLDTSTGSINADAISA